MIKLDLTQTFLYSSLKEWPWTDNDRMVYALLITRGQSGLGNDEEEEDDDDDDDDLLFSDTCIENFQRIYLYLC